MGANPRLKSYLDFFWAGLAKYPQTGTVLPSQRFLLERMVAPIPEGFKGRIVELGTGTGCLTLRLAARCPEARIVSCDINPVLAEDARQNLLRAGVNGNVKVLTAPAQELLRQILNGERERPRYVVSALPLGNLGKQTVLSLIDSIKALLPDDGMFIQVQCFMADRKHVRNAFPKMRTEMVLLNVPPAFVYYAPK